MGNREIADQLHLSRYTVECHIKHIYRKLAVSSRTGPSTRRLARPARLTRPTPVARRAGQALAAMLGLLALLILCGGARAATADAAGDCAARILDVRIAQALPDGARPADGPAWRPVTLPDD